MHIYKGTFAQSLLWTIYKPILVRETSSVLHMTQGFIHKTDIVLRILLTGGVIDEKCCMNYVMMWYKMWC